jgi:membrane protein DedA with SNARE-associated domain
MLLETVGRMAGHGIPRRGEHWRPMEHFLETWGYLAVFVLSFISSVGIPTGADVAVIYGGVLASGQIAHEPHHLNLTVVIVVVTIAEVLGSLVGYAIGLYGGRPLVDRVGRYVLLTHKDLDRAEAWFARRGDPVVLFGRFIPLLRSFVSFAAGLAEMALAKFIVFTTIGCAIWCTALSSLGYALGSSYSRVLKAFSYAGYMAAALAVAVIAALFWHRLRAVRAERG